MHMAHLPLHLILLHFSFISFHSNVHTDSFSTTVDLGRKKNV